MQKFLRVIKNAKGFTFIELVVVIAMFTILSGTLLLNFTRFGRNITIQNLAQDIALQINAAQKQAISGRTNDFLSSCDRTTSDCSPRYGIYLTSSADTTNSVMSSYSGTPGKTLLTFFDYLGGFDNMLLYGNPLCGSGVNTECLDNISLGQGNYISTICVGVGNVCDLDISSDQGVNIVFKRPFPDAIITTDNAQRWNYLRITVTSPNQTDTRSRDIVVTSLGQISIEAHP